MAAKRRLRAASRDSDPRGPTARWCGAPAAPIGRPLTSVLTKLDTPANWAVRIDGPIRASVAVTVHPIDQTRIRVAIDVDFAGHGIGKILVPLLMRLQGAKEMPEEPRTPQGPPGDPTSQPDLKPGLPRTSETHAGLRRLADRDQALLGRSRLRARWEER
jgi:hypothetical protein